METIFGTGLAGPLFFGTIIVVALLELVRPRRPLAVSSGPRWLANMGLGVFNILLARWLLPVIAAVVASAQGFGLFHHVTVAPVLEIVLGILVLDAISYGVHRIMHAVPVLWRVHRVHHTDLDVDFTTGLRHHPVETLITVGGGVLGILVFGLSPLAVLVYQAGRAVIDVASHGNIRVPARLDHVLRLAVITPDMHRVHHSADQQETDSNFGSLLPWWDRIFGTYRQAPALGHVGMRTGLEEWRDETALTISGLVLLPFRATPRQISPRQTNPRTGGP